MAEQPGQPRRLYRSRRDRIVAGVAGGLGEYFGIDPILFRAAFVLLSFSGLGVIVYIFLWLITPEEGEEAKNFEEQVRRTAQGIGDELRAGWEQRGRSQAGLWLVLIGILLLLANLGLFAWGLIGKLWPLILILIGVSILTRNRR